MSSVLVGTLDRSYFPGHPAGADPVGAWRRGEARLVEPGLTDDEHTRAEEVLAVAMPVVEESVRLLCAAAPGRRRPAPVRVTVTTSRAFARASGPATPGRAALALTLPTSWLDAVHRRGPTTLDGGRHVVVHATGHDASGMPSRVLALRVIARPYRSGPPDDLETVFNLAWVRLARPDPAGAPAVAWDPVPTTVEEWLAKPERLTKLG